MGSRDNHEHLSIRMSFVPLLFSTVLGIVIGILGTVAVTHMTSSPTVSLTTTLVSEQLEKCQDLATARLRYHGLSKYEQGDIDLINKKGFTMVYDADIKAGVDLSKASVAINGRQVTIDLPEATIQSVEIDPSSIQYYDEKFALFNWSNKRDATEALKLAKSDAEKQAQASSLADEASKNAKDAIEGLLDPFTQDGTYTITVKTNGTSSTSVLEKSENVADDTSEQSIGTTAANVSDEQ